jgi:type II secretory pathway pseudopilin PulG
LGFFFFEENPEKQRAQTTNYSLAEVGRAIYLFEEKFNRYPKDLDELAPPEGDFIYPTARILDAWGRPIIYKYTQTESKPIKLYSVGVNNKDESGDGDDLNFWRLKIKIQ